jgi:hypothetical protein
MSTKKTSSSAGRQRTPAKAPAQTPAPEMSLEAPEISVASYDPSPGVSSKTKEIAALLRGEKPAEKSGTIPAADGAPAHTDPSPGDQDGAPAHTDNLAPGADPDRDGDSGRDTHDSGSDLAGGGDSGVSGDLDGPLTPLDVAAKLDIEPDALYQMELTGSDGSKVTLEQLKDAYAAQTTSEQGIVKREVAQSGREAALSSDIQALGVLEAMQVLPANVRQQAAEHMNAMAHREYAKFRALIPEIQDDAGRIAYETDAMAFLSGFDLSPAHFGAQTVSMHRFVRDAMQNKKALDKLMAPVAKIPPKPVRRSRHAAPGKTDARSIVKNAQGGSQAVRTAAIKELLKGS